MPVFTAAELAANPNDYSGSITIQVLAYAGAAIYGCGPDSPSGFRAESGSVTAFIDPYSRWQAWHFLAWLAFSADGTGTDTPDQLPPQEIVTGFPDHFLIQPNGNLLPEAVDHLKPWRKHDAGVFAPFGRKSPQRPHTATTPVTRSNIKIPKISHLLFGPRRAY